MSQYVSDIELSGNKLGCSISESVTELSNTLTLSGKGIILDEDDDISEINIRQILSSRHVISAGSEISATFNNSLALSGHQLNVSTLYGISVIDAQQSLGGAGSHTGIVSFWSSNYDETNKKVTLNAPIGSLNRATTQREVSLYGHKHDERYYINDGVIHLGDNSLIPSINGHTHQLSTIDGVVFTNPTNGQILKFNGINWVNAAESGGGGVSSHNQLTGRDAADAHPISAVTNLTETLSKKITSNTIVGIERVTQDPEPSSIPEGWVYLVFDAS